jgi:hypothetical protein
MFQDWLTAEQALEATVSFQAFRHPVYIDRFEILYKK